MNRGCEVRLLVLTLCASVIATAAPAFQAPSSSGTPAGDHIAVLAGGCFWGVEAVFERLIGVKDVVSGFAGGSKASAHYDIVSTGATGHAEAVRVRYDPSKISYEQLLKVFFVVAHDPTQLNRQGPDEGPQYRSAIFYADTRQQAIAEAFIKHLNDAKVFPRPVVTTVVALEGFFPAEAHHQDFVRKNPRYPYVVHNDLPKLVHLETTFPELLEQK